MLWVGFHGVTMLVSLAATFRFLQHPLAKGLWQEKFHDFESQEKLSNYVLGDPP